MGFGQQSGKQGATALAYVIKRHLVGQDGFARSGAALHDIGRTRDHAALEQGIEPFDSTGQAFQLFHARLTL